MAVFRFVVSSGQKSWQIEKEQSQCPILGKKIDDIFKADFLGLAGYSLKITGGTDKDGIPMLKDVEGPVKKLVLLTRGTGFSGKKRQGGKKKKPLLLREGMRKRKVVRGNTISQETMQINCAVAEAGSQKIEEILGAGKEKAAEAAKEAKK